MHIHTNTHIYTHIIIERGEREIIESPIEYYSKLGFIFGKTKDTINATALNAKILGY